LERTVGLESPLSDSCIGEFGSITTDVFFGFGIDFLSSFIDSLFSMQRYFGQEESPDKRAVVRPEERFRGSRTKLHLNSKSEFKEDQICKKTKKENVLSKN